MKGSTPSGATSILHSGKKWKGLTHDERILAIKEGLADNVGYPEMARLLDAHGEDGGYSKNILIGFARRNGIACSRRGRTPRVARLPPRPQANGHARAPKSAPPAAPAPKLAAAAIMERLTALTTPKAEEPAQKTPAQEELEKIPQIGFCYERVVIKVDRSFQTEHCGNPTGDPAIKRCIVHR